ncbi:trigger factor [Thiospirillum jenense]|uniref:Trigger factor n=2 Tax=Thiospirillum jenense TaxID=1653858 RepID=A0A839H9K7_9GAMM|nr:trigger factor [Thiospirillum jenense]
MIVELGTEEFDTAVEKRTQEYMRNARVAGFRPGKVPLSVLRKHYGKQIRHEVFEDLVDSTFISAIKEHELHPAAPPVIEPDIDLEINRYAYKAIFEILPEFELQSIQGHKIKRPLIEINENDVDDMIERLRQRDAEFSPVDRPSADGDWIAAKYIGTVDGQPFQDDKAVPIFINLGNEKENPNVPCPGFESHLFNLSTDQEHEFDLRFPDDYKDSTLAGKDVHFKVEVESVREKTLPSLEELIDNMGVTDGEISTFRAEVHTNMQRELKKRIRSHLRSQVFDALMQANPIIVPKSLIEEETQQIAAQWQSKWKIKNALQSLQPLFIQTAEYRVRLGFLLQKAVKDFNAQADEDSIRNKIEELAETYEEPDVFIKYCYENVEQLGEIKAVVKEDLVIQRLLQDAEIEEEPTRFLQWIDALEAKDSQAIVE